MQVIRQRRNTRGAKLQLEWRSLIILPLFLPHGFHPCRSGCARVFQTPNSVHCNAACRFAQPINAPLSQSPTFVPPRLHHHPPCVSASSRYTQVPPNPRPLPSPSRYRGTYILLPPPSLPVPELHCCNCVFFLLSVSARSYHQKSPLPPVYDTSASRRSRRTLVQHECIHMPFQVVYAMAAALHSQPYRAIFAIQLRCSLFTRDVDIHT